MPGLKGDRGDVGKYFSNYYNRIMIKTCLLIQE